jgi:hypothetical protein
MTDPVVSRLHRCLVEAVRSRGGEPRDAPLKVSEIFQELVPYREVRRALGVDLKADYEHALSRLLAGEGGLLHLEPEDARAELRQEVESPYPFVGLYRKFAECDVWIMEDAADLAEDAAPLSAVGSGPGVGSAPERDSGTHMAPILSSAPRFPEPAAEARSPADPDTLAKGLTPAAERHGTDRRVVARAVECSFCDQPLPVGRRVRYCPSCGSDQRLRPCPRCDEVLDRNWRFCVNCGLEVPLVPSPRPPDPDE